MKRFIALFVSLLMIFTFASCGESRTPTDVKTNTDARTDTDADSAMDTSDENKIRLVTTELINSSGILQSIVSDFTKDTGYNVDVLFVKDSSSALKAAKDGKADLVLVNDKKAEKKFVKENYGVDRYPLMYTELVIVGPENDPASIKGCDEGEDVLEKIAFNKEKFVSLADGSEINKIEIDLWDEDVPNGKTDKWYISAEKSTAQTLSLASDEGAYCLADKVTFLKNSESLALEILVDDAEDLRCEYTLIACNAKQIKNVNGKGAKTFIEWATGENGNELIKKFGKKQYGEAIFKLIENED